MASQIDDVIITRAVSNRSRRNSASSTRSRQPKQEELPTELHTHRRVMVTALLLSLFAFLLVLAMVSYTGRDAANSELSLREIAGVIKGDREISDRIDTTHNWLGLLGAVIANLMYNHTLGISALLVPIILFWWSKELFTLFAISRKTLERSGLLLVACILAAGFFGTLQQITWLPQLPREFSGAVGSFLAVTLTRFTGTIGSLLISLVTLFLCVAYAIDLDLMTTFHKAKLLWAKTLDLAQIGWQRIKNYDRSQEVELAEEEEEEEEEVEEEEDEVKTKRSSRKARASSAEKGAEPARIIRRSAQAEKLSEKEQQDSLFEAEPTIIRPDLAADKRAAALAAAAMATEKPPKAKLNNIEEVEEEEVEEESESIEFGSLPNFVRGAARSAASAQMDHALIPPSELSSVNQGPPELSGGSAPLHLYVEEVHFDDQVEEIRSVDTYDEEIDYTPPSLDLLDEYPDEHVADDLELKMNARILTEKLETFKIKIENVTIAPGPVITQYEFVPAAGVKISQIESLSDDIALALKAKGIRIVAPVPGKGTVGVEIPNHNPSIVHFTSIIKSKAFNDNDNQLPIALGKTIIGETFCTDLAKLPHLLIAGSTGSGKSVGINAILMSLIYRMHPRDLKFVILDPKKVEMSLYAGLKNHFLAASPDIEESIITTPQNSVLILKALVLEMENRYNLLARAGQRKITEYNKKVLDGKIREKDGHVMRPLPYIVCIIDELADLMITARNEVEEPIIRLAQLARAVGIHLVVATQRPSVDVITGLIKANFPARIAYQVASKVDSRTILDASGAEQLLGNGDMLFTRGGVKPLRLQNSYVSTEEVEAITSFIEEQQGYSTPYMLPSVLTVDSNNKVLSGEFDPLFKEAASVIINMQQGSVSLLQRRLKVGYSRAARIMDELESAGVVGPFDGAKARAVLMDSEAELERVL